MMTLELLLLRGKLPLATPPPPSAVVAYLSLALTPNEVTSTTVVDDLLGQPAASVTKLAGGDQGQAACLLGCRPGSTSRELK